MPIRTILVDDHPLMLNALSAALLLDSEIVLVGEATDRFELFKLLSTTIPDTVIMDLALPGTSGLDTIAEVHKALPEVSILVFTASTDPIDIARSFQYGALGYLVKGASNQEIFEAIHSVYHKDVYLHPSFAKSLVQGMHQLENFNQGEALLSHLTKREYHIYTLVGKGLSNAEIAAQLKISEDTARVHIFNIMKKLNIHDRSKLILFSVEHKSL